MIRSIKNTLCPLSLNITDTNFAQKAGPRAFHAAEKEGIAIVMPDTSPRGEGVPNVDSYDLGVGAGFYLNADQEPYSTHYHMYSYVTEELPALLESQFSIGKAGLRSISGHSMGGHGALTIALKEPNGWVSVSAFSPICNREFAVSWLLHSGFYAETYSPQLLALHHYTQPLHVHGETRLSKPTSAASRLGRPTMLRACCPRRCSAPLATIIS